MTRLELGERRVGGVRIEDDQRDPPAGGVDLDQVEHLDRHRPAALGLGGEADPQEREPLAAHLDELALPAAPRKLEQHPLVREEVLAADLHAEERAPVVHHVSRRVGRERRFPVARAPGSLELRPGARRRVRSRRRRRELVEARERLGLAAGIELLPLHQAAVGAEDEELAEVAFERATAVVLHSPARPPDDQRVVARREDVVDRDREVVRQRAERADALQHRVDAPQHAGTDGSHVGELDVGRERLGPALDVDGTQQRGDRARDRRGAVALRAFGEPLGVALVEPRDRVADAARVEHLHTRAAPVPVDLDQREVLALDRAEVEGPGRRHLGDRGRAPADRERVTEAGQRVVDHLGDTAPSADSRATKFRGQS